MRWIFGYGSLIWRPSIPFIEERPALLRGWVRRFWQGSTDHRGVPGAPGRVVTLVRDERGSCWGRAFRVDPAHRETVLEDLDVREQGGYERRAVRLELRGSSEPAPGLVYIATPSNRNYLGPATLERIASQVLRSRGPSGSNVEYVLRLAAALREMTADDEHVFELARLVERAATPSIATP